MTNKATILLCLYKLVKKNTVKRVFISGKSITKKKKGRLIRSIRITRDFNGPTHTGQNING
jgi:hypothetical protein